VVACPLTKTAVATMQAEVERIWGRHNVRIHWLAPGPPHGSNTNIVVLVAADSRRCLPGRANREHTLGCFLYDREGSSGPTITIFPERARRLVVRWVANVCRNCLEGWLERLTATLLGRALAHELGHYLLGPEHSATGLMRSRFDPRDLLTHKRDAFSLRDAQIASLARRQASVDGGTK
jgi:hypothetical protein